jgi:hypothetical protein
VSARYARRRPTRRDDLVAGLIAGGLAAGIGLVTFYVSRLLLARAQLDVPESLTEGIAEREDA